MFEINKELKRNNLPDHIREGLAPLPVQQIKFVIGVLTFFLLDILILIPLLFPTYKIVLYITIPLMVMINLWAFSLLFRKRENIQMESLLFLGYLGIVGSFSYFVLAMKYNYMVGIKSPIYYISMFLIYLLINFLFFRNEHKKYSSLEVKGKKKTPAWQFGLAFIAPSAGYIFAHYLIGLGSFLELSIMSVIYWGISITYIFIFARSFHKYFFIKKNIHLVRFANKELNQKLNAKKVGN
ncbi:hypothetical protein CJ195_24025 [Bacillus sp. UMB0899]|nr:hypothetical protein CJ195_24025 [Bacillus sp. UMB0899]